MGKVNNPYNLEIKDNYYSKSDIISIEDSYNVIITIGSWNDMIYGYDGVSGTITGKIGSLIKNTSGIYFSQFCLVTVFDNLIGLNIMDTSPNIKKIRLESPQGSGDTILYDKYQTEMQVWNIPELSNYFKNNVGSKFMCNLTLIN